MFRSKKSSPRDLSVPSEVEADPKAKEVLRVWVANDGVVCALRLELWKEATSWGIVLADITRHVAHAVKLSMVMILLPRRRRSGPYLTTS